MIKHNQPTLGEKEYKSLKKLIYDGNLSLGNATSKFEKDLSNFLNVDKKKIVVVNSGSSALFLAFKAMLKPRSKIAIPVYGCSSLYQAAKLANLNIKYFDIKSGSLDFSLPNQRTYDGIVIPHLFGIPSSIDKINKTKLIEDCSQSFGAKINNKIVGTNGRFGIFSFKSTKLITSGGAGGAIYCKYLKDASKIRSFISYDMKSNSSFGFNYLMTDLNATIGSIQLARFKNEFIKKRKKIFEYYEKNGIKLLKSFDKNKSQIHYRAIVSFENKKNRDYIYSSLKKKGIELIIPISKKEILKENNKNFVGANRNTDIFLSLPCYPSLTKIKLDFIIKSFKEYQSNLKL